MHSQLKSLRTSPLIKWLVVMAAGVAFSFSVLLATSASLHHLWHADAGDASHQCAVSHFSRTKALAPDVSSVRLVFEPAISLVIFSLTQPILEQFDYRLPPSRAPPRLRS